MSNEQKLRQAFIDSLGIPTTSDFDSLEYRGIEEWDSVAHMQLVGEIEAVFDLMLDTEDVIEMSSYKRAREIIVKYGVVV